MQEEEDERLAAEAAALEGGTGVETDVATEQMPVESVAEEVVEPSVEDGGTDVEMRTVAEDASPAQLEHEAEVVEAVAPVAAEPTE